MSVTLLAGLCQLTMRVFRLGVLATYMSMPFISAFMTGSAVQIMVSQVGFTYPIKNGGLVDNTLDYGS